MITLDTVGLFILLAGCIIGLGAVTVIDVHGLLGRTSRYWTEATTRTHKVTKLLIWLGFALAYVGGFIFYREQGFAGVPLWQCLIGVVLVANGLFLSFRVSPMLQREREGRAAELLPASWQRAIAVSFIISFVGWWTIVGLLAWQLSQ